jgi:excisionase family DNA binding protein
VTKVLYDYLTGSEELGMSARTLRRYVTDGEISHVRLGRLTRFRQEDLDAFIEARRVPGGQDVAG